MEFIHTIPAWTVGLLIFSLRIVDVSIGTVRTIAMVQGHARIAVGLAFFEVLVWVVAVVQVVARIDESPLLAPFYAGGHAAGVAVGMYIERKLALGRFAIRILSTHKASEIADAVAGRGRVLGTFSGQSGGRPVNLIFVSAMRRHVPGILEAARRVDPELFYLVEMAAGWSENMRPLPDATGWRAVFKKK